MTPVDVDRNDLILKRRRQRSIALALVLVAFVLIVYVLTFVKMGMYHTL
ncbi:MAG TPA: hypothetical protein VHB23_01705 [Devosiaceae bacterium]|jgi:hypothetical protein|nr:hypothetical protein [Devosiaceae bacterium]